MNKVIPLQSPLLTYGQETKWMSFTVHSVQQLRTKCQCVMSMSMCLYLYSAPSVKLASCAHKCEHQCF